MPRLPIRRHQHGEKSVYRAGGRRITNAREIARLDELAIPPAWTEVEISRSSTAKVLARGVDDAGRTQAIYSAAYRRKQDKAKFARILLFAERLPRLRKQVEHDLKRRRLGEDKVIACIIKLIDQHFFRVGNEKYARAHRHYGVTTLRRKHTDLTATKVTFDFVGKSGKRLIKVVREPQLVRIIRQLNDMPGHEIFRFFDEDGIIHNVDSSRVNAYVKRHMGKAFSAKDFRTWGGTLLATSALLVTQKDGESDDGDAAVIRKVTAHVAERLGNTPAVTKNSYIDPRVFAAFEDGVTMPKLQRSMDRMRPRKYMTVEEQCVLKVLRRR